MQGLQMEAQVLRTQFGNFKNIESKKIIPGSLVKVRGEEWRVIRKRFFTTSPHSDFEIEAEGLTGVVIGHKSVFLSNLDEISLVHPDKIIIAQDESKGFIQTKIYLESLLRKLPIRNDDKICVGHKGVFDPYLYQLQPALKALDQLRPRILIGDGVGLGKTVEVGILLSELIKRGKGRRILVITPKSILTQFQKEMFNRFGIALTRLDSNGIAELNRNIPSTMNPFMFHDRVIISMDTLKNKRYLTALERCDWDTIVIDECHNVSIKGGNTKNQRAKLAKTLCDRAEAVILASATPHDGTMEGFASLIKLLDPTSIRDERNYDAQDIENVFIRRTKNNVSSEIRNGKARDNVKIDFNLNDNEVQVLKAINSLDLDCDIKSKSYKKIKGAGFIELFKTTLVKGFLSSPYALIDTIENKIENKSTNEADTKKLKNILALTKKVQTPNFTKYKKLLEIATGLAESNSRLVIFTERRATLKFLEEQLIRDKIYKSDEILVMHGSMGDVDAQDVASRFQSAKDKVKVLLATNVAAEGLNLHHNCNHLIHFDLPWSFIILEQRNGRIDRLGQLKVPRMYYMCARSNDPEVRGDLHITDKLSQRMENASISMDDESLEAGFLSGEEEAIQMTFDFECSAGDQKSQQLNAHFDFFNMANGKTIDLVNDTFDGNVKELESFYDSDQDFLTDALSVLNVEHSSTKDKVTVALDRELRSELDTAPKEIFKNDNVIFLFDKKKMEKEIQNSVQFNEWSSFHWASDHHPLLEWVINRCSDIYPGENTPVVFYRGKDEDHKMGFLMQGILYNKHGQIIFEEWAVCTYETMFKKDGEPYGPYSISEIKKWTGLSGQNVANPKEKLTPRLEKSIMSRATSSVNWMEEVMKTKREERKNKLYYKIKKENDRLKSWENDRREALTSEIAKLEMDKTISSSLSISELKAERERLNKILSDYQAWVKDHYSSDKMPIVRIMGIFINAGKA